MSVNVKDRGEQHFLPITESRELAKYTVQITSNAKIFSPQYNRGITDDIVATAKDVFISAYAANGVRVACNEDFDLRHKLQLKAISACNRLLPLIELARPIFHLSSKRLEYWIGKTFSVRDLLRKWRDSDASRYKVVS